MLQNVSKVTSNQVTQTSLIMTTCTYLAGLPRPLWRTEAFEAVLHVDAGSTPSTGVGGAFIGV